MSQNTTTTHPMTDRAIPAECRDYCNAVRAAADPDAFDLDRLNWSDVHRLTAPAGWEVCYGADATEGAECWCHVADDRDGHGDSLYLYRLPTA